MRKKMFILGAKGFVGRHLRMKFPKAIALSRAEFELGSESDYDLHNYDNSIIVDCMSLVDGIPHDIYLNNVVHFSHFVNYLANTHTAFKYVYISTMSTLSEDKETTAYVASKTIAELYLETFDIDYKIIRLSYPFGEGENPNRLISRLIAKIRDKTPIIIDDDVELALTPIEYLLDYFEFMLSQPENEVDFTAGSTIPVSEIVEVLRLGIENPYNALRDYLK